MRLDASRNSMKNVVLTNFVLTIYIEYGKIDDKKGAERLCPFA